MVKLKRPTEILGYFGASDGANPAYNMNKLRWISMLLPYSPSVVVHF
jgi:predicted DNA-binding protein (MmcQ/YjbR family)